MRHAWARGWPFSGPWRGAGRANAMRPVQSIMRMKKPPYGQIRGPVWFTLAGLVLDYPANDHKKLAERKLPTRIPRIGTGKDGAHACLHSPVFFSRISYGGATSYVVRGTGPYTKNTRPSESVNSATIGYVTIWPKLLWNEIIDMVSLPRFGGIRAPMVDQSSSSPALLASFALRSRSAFNSARRSSTNGRSFASFFANASSTAASSSLYFAS